MGWARAIAGMAARTGSGRHRCEHRGEIRADGWQALGPGRRREGTDDVRASVAISPSLRILVLIRFNGADSPVSRGSRSVDRSTCSVPINKKSPRGTNILRKIRIVFLNIGLTDQRKSDRKWSRVLRELRIRALASRIRQCWFRSESAFFSEERHSPLQLWLIHARFSALMPVRGYRVQM